MTSSDTQLSRGLVIGCGGTLGAAWTVAALVAVSDALGWDPRDADVLVGTSAGAELVTMLGGGAGVDELLAMQLGGSRPIRRSTDHLAAAPGRFPPLPRLGPRLARSWCARAAPRGGTRDRRERAPPPRPRRRRLARPARTAVRTCDSGWVRHPATWLVAWTTTRESASRSAHPVRRPRPCREALRASWAIPGWYPPVRIGGRRFVDGGAASTASADLVLPLELDEVVVLAPMASTGRIPARGAARANA